MGVLSGQSARSLLALALEVIDSTRAGASGSLHSAATHWSGPVKQSRTKNKVNERSMLSFFASAPLSSVCENEEEELNVRAQSRARRIRL